jgi:hypothetical protein
MVRCSSAHSGKNYGNVWGLMDEEESDARFEASPVVK